jgi:hypothetical protein
VAQILYELYMAHAGEKALIEAALEISRQEIELKSKMKEAIEQKNLEKVLEIAKLLTGLA